MDQRRSKNVGGSGDTSNMRSTTTTATDKYRALAHDSDRLSGVAMPAFLAEQHQKAVAAALRAAADEVDRLRTAFENAPHEIGCESLWRLNYRLPCTCWKAYML